MRDLIELMAANDAAAERELAEAIVDAQALAKLADYLKRREQSNPLAALLTTWEGSK